MRVTLLGSRRHSSFTDGGRELFDCAAQGRIDAFFLAGGEIDGEANVNLVGCGGYPDSQTRFPGSFGSAYLYFLIPRVILFREEHSPRVLVPKVEFISAPGVSADGVYRRGGPVALVTGRAAFSFNHAQRRFRLESIHPDHGIEEVLEATGFEFDRPATVPVTEPPTDDMLTLMRGPLVGEIAETYPRFATSVFGAAGQTEDI